MRSTKVIAFSVPPEFEHEIQKHAKAEHRTISVRDRRLRWRFHVSNRGGEGVGFTPGR